MDWVYAEGAKTLAVPSTEPHAELRRVLKLPDSGDDAVTIRGFAPDMSQEVGVAGPFGRQPIIDLHEVWCAGHVALPAHASWFRPRVERPRLEIEPFEAASADGVGAEPELLGPTSPCCLLQRGGQRERLEAM